MSELMEVETSARMPNGLIGSVASIDQAMGGSAWCDSMVRACKQLYHWCQRPTNNNAKNLLDTVALMTLQSTYEPGKTGPSSYFICEAYEIPKLLEGLLAGSVSSQEQVILYLQQRVELGWLLEDFRVSSFDELLTLFQATGKL